MNTITNKILEVVKNHPTPSSKDIQEATDLSERTVINQLTELVKKGKIIRMRRLDDTRRTYFKVIEGE